MYLLRNGSERVVSSAREHTYDMRMLESYTYTDEHNRDQGINGTATLQLLHVLLYQEEAKLVILVCYSPTESQRHP